MTQYALMARMRPSGEKFEAAKVEKRKFQQSWLADDRFKKWLSYDEKLGMLCTV